ncbi:unnamed protein product [Staurois parvus]|uniref:Uncharacterized protein n=1 Tax=Staurois parvus TaxID=386267 RepID=A0ABN9B5H3_9NEOB|nr:unnamed protein product [Staurois parvus]
MQSGKYRSPGNHQTQTRPSDCQTEKRDWSLQIEHVSTALESSGGVLFITASGTLHCTWCWKAWMQLLGAMETHSMKLSTHCCWAHLKATPSLEVFSY